MLFGPRREKTCLRGFANNTGADQPAHPRRLISAYVIPFLKCIISKLASREISIFYLVSVAEETGLNLTLSETPKTGFLATRPILWRVSCQIDLLTRTLLNFVVYESRTGGKVLYELVCFILCNKHLGYAKYISYTKQCRFYIFCLYPMLCTHRHL